MLRERQINIGALSLNLAAGPAGQAPLLFIHGITGRWQQWLNVMPAFANRWQVLAVDLRGHGRSDRQPGPYRIVDYAADIAALLRATVDEPVCLVGHSLGAIISIAVAAEAPALVRAVILEDPPLGPFIDESIQARPEREHFTKWQRLAGPEHSFDELLAALSPLMPGADGVALRARAASLRQLDPAVLATVLADRGREGLALEADLARIMAPTLLLQGNVVLGGALDDARAAAAAARLARGTHVYLDNVGHAIHADQPIAFCRLALDFLETIDD